MLYSPTQFARDQLLTDLLAVRAKLEASWLKGGWRNGESVCMVAAVQTTVGTSVGSTTISVHRTGEPTQRLGRALAAIYMALYGPHAPTNVTMSQVMHSIIRFNDGAATHGSVLLLLDRAIAAVHEQAGAMVTATG